jgi:hypothetical protein
VLLDYGSTPFIHSGPVHFTMFHWWFMRPIALNNTPLCSSLLSSSSFSMRVMCLDRDPLNVLMD